MSDTMNFTPEMRDELQEIYNRAVVLKDKEIFYQGQMFDVLYVKYLLEYLDSMFGTSKISS